MRLSDSGAPLTASQPPPAKLTPEILLKVFPDTKADVVLAYAPHIIKLCEKKNINTPTRIAAFLATIGEESGGLSKTRESTNYSSTALLAKFGKYYAGKVGEHPTQKNKDGTPVMVPLAEAHHRQSEKIANTIYANRMDNGDYASGDGWRYRGRGLIQVTGKANYTAYAKSAGVSMTGIGEWLESPAGAVDSAGWFWETNNLNQIADTHGIIGVSKVVNAGSLKAKITAIHNLPNREALFTRAKMLLEGGAFPGLVPHLPKTLPKQQPAKPVQKPLIPLLMNERSPMMRDIRRMA